MEPGHEDREYQIYGEIGLRYGNEPQWSPVMKTGNTRARRATSSSPGRLNGARS